MNNAIAVTVHDGLQRCRWKHYVSYKLKGENLKQRQKDAEEETLVHEHGGGSDCWLRSMTALGFQLRVVTWDVGCGMCDV